MVFEIFFGLIGVLLFWFGVMKIGENSGLINVFLCWLSLVFCCLFLDILKGYLVMGFIFMNMFVNMLGFDNVVIFMGLKVMKEL